MVKPPAHCERRKNSYCLHEKVMLVSFLFNTFIHFFTVLLHTKITFLEGAAATFLKGGFTNLAHAIKFPGEKDGERESVCV